MGGSNVRVEIQNKMKKIITFMLTTRPKENVIGTLRVERLPYTSNGFSH